MGKIKIAIDAGHGSRTAGKRTPPFTKNVDINGDGIIDVKKGEQYREHYANVGVANLLYKKLVNRGYDVLKTGWDDSNSKDDSDEALSSRQKKIKSKGCEYSVSIHFNAYGDGKSFNSAKGVGIFIHSKYPANSRQFAEYVLRELIKGTPQTNRGIHVGKYAMCNCNVMKTKGSIICELAFMTNEAEATQLMANQNFWAECAEEIADAIDRFCNCNDEEESIPTERIRLYHTIVSGETLSKIAKQYNTTIEHIVTLNQINDPGQIAVGQKILISEYIKYTVQKGDTLSGISLRFLKDADRYKEIMDLNNMNSSTIYINQILKIPID